jgi:hypothetical protein
MADLERRGKRGMRGDWLGGWSSLTGVMSIGCGKNEVSIRKQGRVGLVGRIAPSEWGGEVIERWRGGW